MKKDDDFLKLANELDSERISKTNKQQREESQFLSSHKGLTCPYCHKDVAANPASEGRLLSQQSTGTQTQLQRATHTCTHPEREDTNHICLCFECCVKSRAVSRVEI